ncbi:hypothetical protein COU78_01455 [Candidatus Peregrinibacteria bacterium CG10_big_fil_rev_8_21_14_0_10_49_24]|nr:MAG: hypothetical protein COV83_04420 [Candidatus Peregrinibacteria bacterium CG11_big_fil_rev_8_21_14_0_20_49_14]PIR51391.1 MAG: hypothetical protein COU78_01455 [Candidatus Peregrinibacteria bacterium CG10_big_fil_rev_8_21_14_0_10_49_24]PJA68155.1 MAG: hypothetical protein CO157_01270 [Candidatus Peregrinibacteria bacterium CG_4_9_14_3_um_filter_49_12]
MMLTMQVSDIPHSLGTVLRNRFVWFYGFLALVITLVFTALVPFHQDEFIHYIFIRCAQHPYLQMFVQEDCTGFWHLNFLNTGLLLPLRAYWYAGSIPALFYYPLYLVWTSPTSARLLGVLWLLVQAGILSKVFRMRFSSVFAGLVLFFPYFFQHIVDTGPVAIQITSVYLLYVIFLLWVETERVRYALYTALVIFVCVWTKLVYLWLFPGIAVLFILAVQEKRSKPQRVSLPLLKQIGISIAVATGLLSLLFLSTDPFIPGKFVYMSTLLQGDSYSLSEILRQFWSLDAVRLLFNPLEASHRIFHVGPTGLFAYIYDVLTFGTLPVALFVMSLLKKKELSSVIRTSAVLYGLFLLTFFFTLRTKEVWAMHHVILSFSFLVLAYAVLCSEWKTIAAIRFGAVRVSSVVTCIVSVWVVLNVVWFSTFYRQPVRTMADVSRNSIHHILNDPYLAKHYIYISLENGLYFYQALYGHKDQSITFKNPLTEEWQIRQIQDLGRQTGRKILFVYDTVDTYSDYELIHRNFRTVPCKATDPKWVWQIFLEDDGNSENICL